MTQRQLFVSVHTALVWAALVSASSSAAPRSSVELQVDVVSTTDGSPVPSAYVAVVPETSPWADPTREVVIESGSAVNWRLPAGRYRIVAGAPGYTVSYGPVIDLRGGSRYEETANLVQMAPVEGRVLDSDGVPIPGATVSHLRRLVLDFSRRLSPLGESWLRPSFEAVSDDDGRFRIPLHPTAGQFLAVRAEGRAPRIFPNLSASQARSTLREVELTRGASLTLSWASDDASSSAYDRLQILPKNRQFPPGLDLSLAVAVWGRPFPAEAAAAWPSLPPGEYEIYLKGPPRGPHSTVPLDLGSVVLSPGKRTDLQLQLPPLASQPAAVEGDDRIELLLPEQPASETESLRVVAWQFGDASVPPRELPFTAVRASGGLLLRVVARCRKGATFEVVTANRIGSVSIEHPPCGEVTAPARVALAPRGDVELRVVPPPGESLPPVARFDVGPCDPKTHTDPPTPPMHLAATISSLQDGSGRIETPMTAGCASVIGRIGAFAPISWSALKLSPNQSADLGPFRLRYGAALLVRVVSGLDGRPLDGVAAWLVDPDRAVDEIEEASRSTDEEHRMDSAGPPMAKGATSDGGWVRLAGLPPGRALVLMLQSKGRAVPYAALDLEFAPGEEKVLDFVELPPPSSLEVRVELSRRLEEMGAKPYQIALRRTGSDGPPVSFARDLGPNDHIVFEDLPAGAWRLLGIVRAEDGRPFPAGSADVVLAPGERRTVELPLRDSIYQGRVTFEGIPVEGSISVAPVSPADRRGMSVPLDEEGRFRLPLEGPGTYTVRVFDDRDRRFDAATIPAVRFAEPDDEMTLQVPEGRIEGIVIDTAGEPVPNARVELRSRQELGDGRFLEVRTFHYVDASGGFLAEGLAAGDWTASASADGLESAARVVPLQPAERVSDLELVVAPSDRVSGRVLDDAGRPERDARVEITPQPSTATETVPFLRAVTDSDGRFELTTSYAGRPANVRIVTASGASTAIRTELDSAMRIDLPPTSGRIEIELPCPGRLAGISGAHFLVSERGGFLPLPALGDSRRVSEEPCRIVRQSPGIAIGRWRIVKVETAADEALLFLGQGLLLESLGVLVAEPGRPSSERLADPESAYSGNATSNER